MPSPSSRKRSRTVRASVLSSKTVFRGPDFSVVSEQVAEPPGGDVVRRDLVRHPSSVVILPLDDSARPVHVLLERQYRHAAEKHLWELPAGSRERGETSLAGAKRELLEETGYTAAKWQRALFFYVSPGFLTENMHLFLARGLTKRQARPMADEHIEVRRVPVKQAVRMVMTGKIVDAKTIAALLWLAHGPSREFVFGRSTRVQKSRKGLLG